VVQILSAQCWKAAVHCSVVQILSAQCWKAAVHCSVVQILSRKQSVPSGDCRGHSGAYVFRVVPTLGGRRTTDTTTA